MMDMEDRQPQQQQRHLPARVQPPVSGSLVKLDQHNLQQYNDVANVLVPTSAFLQVNPLYVARIEQVFIDMSADSEEVYGDPAAGGYRPDFLKQNERALSKKGIMRIADAAGITWDLDRCRRVDPAPWKDDVVTYTAVGGIRKPDGNMAWKVATKCTNIPAMIAAGEKIPKTLRKFIFEQTETKAKLRVIRELLNLKQKYTVDRLKLPFITPCLVFSPDMNDPEVKRIMLLAGAGAIKELMGPSAAPQYAIEATTAAQEKVNEMKGLGPGQAVDGPQKAGPNDETTQLADDDEEEMRPAIADAKALYDGYVARFNAAASFPELRQQSIAATRQEVELGEYFKPLCDLYRSRKAAMQQDAG